MVVGFDSLALNASTSRWLCSKSSITGFIAPLSDFKTMAIGARTTHAKADDKEQRFFVRDRPTRLGRTQRPSQSLHNPPQTNTRRSGQVPRPHNPSRATAAHACPGAIEGCAASPRGPGRVPSRWHETPRASSFATSPNSAAAIRRGQQALSRRGRAARAVRVHSPGARQRRGCKASAAKH